MKKFAIVLLILVSFAVPAFALDFGVQYTKQLEDPQLDYFGVTVKVFEEKFLGVDLVALTPSLMSSTNPLTNLFYLMINPEDVDSAELLPYVRFNLRLRPLWLYLGAAPVVDLSFPVKAGGGRDFGIALRDPFVGAAKVGLQFNLLILGVYAEAGTYFDLDFNFWDYRASLGAVINF